MKNNKRFILIIISIFLTLPFSTYAQETNIIEGNGDIRDNKIKQDTNITQEDQNLEMNAESEEQENELELKNDQDEANELIEQEKSEKIESEDHIDEIIDSHLEEEPINDELVEMSEKDQLQQSTTDGDSDKNIEIEDNIVNKEEIIDSRIEQYERFFDFGGIKRGIHVTPPSGNPSSSNRPYVGIVANKPIILNYENKRLTGTSVLFKARIYDQTSYRTSVTLRYSLKIYPLDENRNRLKNSKNKVMYAQTTNETTVRQYDDEKITYQNYKFNNVNDDNDTLKFVSANKFEAALLYTSAFSGSDAPTNNYTWYEEVPINNKTVKLPKDYVTSFNFGEYLETYVQWGSRDILKDAEFTQPPHSFVDYGSIEPEQEEQYNLNMQVSFVPNTSQDFSLLAVNSPIECDCTWKRYIVMSDFVEFETQDSYKEITVKQKVKLDKKPPEENHRFEVVYYLIDNKKLEDGKNLSNYFPSTEDEEDHTVFDKLKDTIIAKSIPSSHYLNINFSIQDTKIFELNNFEDNKILNNKIEHNIYAKFKLESSYCYGVDTPNKFNINISIEDDSLSEQETIQSLRKYEIPSGNLLSFVKDKTITDQHVYTMEVLINLDEDEDFISILEKVPDLRIKSSITKGESEQAEIIRSSYERIDLIEQQSIFAYRINEMKIPSQEEIEVERIFVDEIPAVGQNLARKFDLDQFKTAYLQKYSNYTFYNIAEQSIVETKPGVKEDVIQATDKTKINHEILEKPTFVSFYIKNKLVDSQTHLLNFRLYKFNRIPSEVTGQFDYMYSGEAVQKLNEKTEDGRQEINNDLNINPFLVYSKGFKDNHTISAKLTKTDENPLDTGLLYLQLYIETFEVKNFSFNNNSYPETVFDQSNIHYLSENNSLNLDIIEDHHFNAIAIITKKICEESGLVVETEADYISKRPMEEGDINQRVITWSINSKLNTNE